MAYSEDPDQTVCSVAPDLGLHCLVMPPFFGTVSVDGLVDFILRVSS